MSEGKFQYDLWNVTPLTETDGTLNWPSLKEKVHKFGVRNSLLIAPMPTASTSQILVLMKQLSHLLLTFIRDAH